MVWVLAPTCTVRVVGVAAASKVDRIRGSFNDNGIGLLPPWVMIPVPRQAKIRSGMIDPRLSGNLHHPNILPLFDSGGAPASCST
jgi:hypothetical protein